ncbi:MAG: NIPSNAP family protein [Gammaproteobacteria bacterium]|nr:NIPSNAP family protein [Gammaproteobacteria bacterium]
MSKNNTVLTVFGMAIFGMGVLTGKITQFTGVAEAQSADRVFELRTYTANPGHLAELNARFGDHTVELFERHGMMNIGYFVPQDSPLSQNTLVYLLAHDSREAAQASWDGFRSDPDWQAVRASSTEGMVDNIESVFLSPTSYSQLR